MDEALCITGPYEAELSQGIVLLMASAPGSELRVTTQPGMGVVTYTLAMLNQMGKPYTSIYANMIWPDEAMAMPYPKPDGSVGFHDVAFSAGPGHKDGNLILIQDTSQAYYEKLIHIVKWVEEQKALGSRVIYIFSGNA